MAYKTECIIYQSGGGNMIKKDILIVDDDMDLAMITKDLLEYHGYSVEIANSVDTAFLY